MTEGVSCALNLAGGAELIDPDHPADVRLLSREIAFSHFRFEAVIKAPSTVSDTLLGASIKLGGTVAVGTGAQPTPTSPNDVRLFLNEHDVTSAFSRLVIDLIAADEAVLRSQYREAMTRWLDMLVQYPGPNIDRAAHNALRDQLVVDPLSTLLDSLGSDDHTRFGFGGTLHLFNFLYRDIQIPPVSLADVIDLVNTTTPGAIDPTVLDDFTLVVSLGPSRYHTNPWVRPIPRGGVLIDVLYEYHNPLNDVIDGIKEELESLEEQILTAVERIDQKFWPDDSTTPHGEPVLSIVKHYLVPLDNTVADLKTSVEDVEASVSSLDHQAVAIENKADELKRAIEAL